MKTENVLAALVIHSQKLDFGRPDPKVIAASEKKKGKAKPDNWREVRDADGKIDPAATLPAIRTALGNGTRRVPRDRLTEAASDALVGIRKRDLRTIEVALGINAKARKAIKCRLLAIAIRSREGQKFWPDPEDVTRRACHCGREPAEDYLEDLVELAIRELEYPDLLRTHVRRAEWFGMAESTWYRDMRRPYVEVIRHLWGWYLSGLRHIAWRLNQIRRDQWEDA